jgi:hypothetical protein
MDLLLHHPHHFKVIDEFGRHVQTRQMRIVHVHSRAGGVIQHPHCALVCGRDLANHTIPCRQNISSEKTMRAG